MSDEPVIVDRALLAAWRDHPGHIAETRAVVADWHAAVVSTPAEATPTGPWLAHRLALVLDELDRFTGAVEQVARWQQEQIIDAMEQQFPEEAP
jgi:hypothetical protein